MNIECYAQFGTVRMSFPWKALPRDFWIEAIRFLEQEGFEMDPEQAEFLEAWVEGLPNE